jgi:Xaa-Pro aminopeptidase
MRLTKDEYEIAAMRRATDISVEGMKEGMRRTRVGMTSMELAGIMEATWKREGSHRTAFAPIVTAGLDAVMLYGLRRENYNPLDHTFADGELVFVDYGAAEFDHYASDVARTFPANGTFTAEQRKYYEIVVEAQRAAIEEARPGARMIDLVRAAAQVYKNHGLAYFEDIGEMGPDKVWGIFPSPSFYLQSDEVVLAAQRDTGLRARALGHHVGIVVTEPADMMMPFEPGMIFTVEPKIYSPSLPAGIMVEDMILITDDGHENLSAGVPRDPDEIERLMAGR